MLQNKEEVTFGKLLKALREVYGVKQGALARGLCSKSMMCYFESGNRLPDYWMRNRLMSRLGLSGEGYEDFLQPEEYNRYLQHQELMHCIEYKKTEEAERVLRKLLNTLDDENKIEYQFLLDMKARLYRQLDRTKEEIFEVYDKAINLTIPEHSIERLDELILAPEEYYLLLQQTRYLPNEQFKREILCCIVERIISSQKDSIALAKILPLAVVTLGQMLLENAEYEPDDLSKCLGYCLKAVEALRDSKRLYYIRELLELTEIFYKLCESDNRNEQRIMLKQVLKGLQDLDERYPNPVKIEDDCYIYHGARVFCVGEVISARRKMFRMTRAELAEGICSVKTLSRIENKKINAQQAIINELFERLKLPTEYRRAELSTVNPKVLRRLDYFSNLLNNRRDKEAEDVLNEIRAELDYRYLQNKQMVIRMVNLLKLHNREITKERLIDVLWKTLSISGVAVENAFQKDNYLTPVERLCLYSILMYSNALEQAEEYMEWYGKKLEQNGDISYFELMYTWCAGEEGNRKNYEKSNEMIEKIISKEMSFQRDARFTSNMLNLCWNCAKMNDDYSNPVYLEKFKLILAYSYFVREQNRVGLVTNIIKIYEEGKNWT